MTSQYNPAEEGIKAAKRDALPWKYSDRGMFRSLPEVATFHNGKPVWMRESEEYIEGRWEASDPGARRRFLCTG